MQPEIGQAQVVAAEAWEARLAEEAASRLAEIVSWKSEPAIAKDLLAGLLEIKKARRETGLNHWPDHAPAFLHREAQRLLEAEAARQREAEAFVRARHDEALAFALTFLEEPGEAEDTVVEAGIKLWIGETSPRYYFRTLKQLVLNKLKRLNKELEIFDSLEDFERGRIRRTSDLWENVNVFKAGEEEPLAAADSGDPLARLLHEAAVSEAILEVQTNRRRRGVRDRAWWRELIAHREEVSRK